MQVSGKIIGFPVPLTPPPAPSAVSPKGHGEIVCFPAVAAVEPSAVEAQDHGKIFAAHRIAARLADQLDQAATL
jgi:hypothetical protein